VRLLGKRGALLLKLVDVLKDAIAVKWKYEFAADMLQLFLGKKINGTWCRYSLRYYLEIALALVLVLVTKDLSDSDLLPSLSLTQAYQTSSFNHLIRKRLESISKS
jgi:hypothetical protein